MTLLKAMATVGGLTGLSRIFGFIRDVLTASILGAGPVADAFFVALKLPNFFRRVTAEGAFSVSFVPLYSKTLEQEGQKQAHLFASNAFFMMLGILSAFVLLAMAFMPYVLYAVAPGFIGDEARFDLAVELSRVSFPYLLLMSLTALLGGVLNAHDKFAPFAFAPVLFNVCLIAALLLNGYFDTAGHALAWGIFAAGFVQFFWLLSMAWTYGFKLKFLRPQFDSKIKEVFKLMGPGVIGAGVMHINLFADLIIASFLGTGAISYLFYADRLNQLPLGMVGIAVGAALLPMLSKALAAGDQHKARGLFNQAMEYCFLLALPAAAALIVIPELLISVLFERGAFTASDSLATSYVLMGYALGLPAYIAVKVFSTAHWARQDTITPVRISIIATLTNIILSLILVQFIGVAGIALGTGLTGWMQFVMHVRALKGYEAAQFEQKFLFNVIKIMISVSIMMFVLIVLQNVLSLLISSYIVLIILVCAGAGTYGLAILGTGAVQLSAIKKYVRR